MMAFASDRLERVTMPSQPLSRRGLLGLVALGAAGLVVGCPGRVPSLSEPGDSGMQFKGKDDALAYALSTVGEGYGEDFELIGEKGDSESGGVLYWGAIASPVARPGEAFGLTIHVGAGDASLRDGPFSDYSQHLFKARAERPFFDALGSCDGIAGFGAHLVYVRYDERVWRESDFEEYMGGRGGDPRVRVAVMLPRAQSDDERAEVVSACLERLFALDRAAEIYFGVEGYDPFSNPVRAAYVDEIFPSDRKAAPSAGDVLEELASASFFDPDGERWDGAGTARSVPCDPGDTSTRPDITWNPGYGPEHW